MNINEAADILSINPDKPKSDLRLKFEDDCLRDVHYIQRRVESLAYGAWLAGYQAGLKVGCE